MNSYKKDQLDSKPVHTSSGGKVAPEADRIGLLTSRTTNGTILPVPLLTLDVLLSHGMATHKATAVDSSPVVVRCRLSLASRKESKMNFSTDKTFVRTSSKHGEESLRKVAGVMSFFDH